MHEDITALDLYSVSISMLAFNLRSVKLQYGPTATWVVDLTTNLRLTFLNPSTAISAISWSQLTYPRHL